MSNHQEKFIIGLGNPGKKYDNNRHNIGFLFIQEFANKYSSNFLLKNKLKCKYSEFISEGITYRFFMPTTFMNNSGKAVRYWALKEKIPLQNILIITDDLHLPFGDLRLRSKGSPAGHNGLKDVENQLNTSNYPRLRFGIGQNYKTFDQVKFVLDQWDETEKTKIEERVSICTEAIECFGLEGINNAMNKFNGK